MATPLPKATTFDGTFSELSRESVVMDTLWTRDFDKTNPRKATENWNRFRIDVLAQNRVLSEKLNELQSECEDVQKITDFMDLDHMVERKDANNSISLKLQKLDEEVRKVTLLIEKFAQYLPSEPHRKVVETPILDILEQFLHLVRQTNKRTELLNWLVPHLQRYLDSSAEVKTWLTHAEGRCRYLTTLSITSMNCEAIVEKLIEEMIEKKIVYDEMMLSYRGVFIVDGVEQFFNVHSNNLAKDKCAVMGRWDDVKDILTNYLKEISTEKRTQIDNQLKIECQQCCCSTPYEIKKVGESRYTFGTSKTIRMVRQHGQSIVVRVGGGWEYLLKFLAKVDPCRAKELAQDYLNSGNGEITCDNGVLLKSMDADDSSLKRPVVRLTKSVMPTKKKTTSVKSSPTKATKESVITLETSSKIAPKTEARKNLAPTRSTANSARSLSSSDYKVSRGRSPGPNKKRISKSVSCPPKAEREEPPERPSTPDLRDRQSSPEVVDSMSRLFSMSPRDEPQEGTKKISNEVPSIRVETPVEDLKYHTNNDKMMKPTKRRPKLPPTGRSKGPAKSSPKTSEVTDTSNVDNLKTPSKLPVSSTQSGARARGRSADFASRRGPSPTPRPTKLSLGREGRSNTPRSENGIKPEIPKVSSRPRAKSVPKSPLRLRAASTSNIGPRSEETPVTTAWDDSTKFVSTKVDSLGSKAAKMKTYSTNKRGAMTATVKNSVPSTLSVSTKNGKKQKPLVRTIENIKDSPASDADIRKMENEKAKAEVQLEIKAESSDEKATKNENTEIYEQLEDSCEESESMAPKLEKQLEVNGESSDEKFTKNENTEIYEQLKDSCEESESMAPKLITSTENRGTDMEESVANDDSLTSHNTSSEEIEECLTAAPHDVNYSIQVVRIKGKEDSTILLVNANIDASDQTPRDNNETVPYENAGTPKKLKEAAPIAEPPNSSTIKTSDCDSFVASIANDERPDAADLIGDISVIGCNSTKTNSDSRLAAFSQSLKLNEEVDEQVLVIDVVENLEDTPPDTIQNNETKEGSSPVEPNRDTDTEEHQTTAQTVVIIESQSGVIEPQESKVNEENESEVRDLFHGDNAVEADEDTELTIPNLFATDVTINDAQQHAEHESFEYIIDTNFAKVPVEEVLNLKTKSDGIGEATQPKKEKETADDNDSKTFNAIVATHTEHEKDSARTESYISDEGSSYRGTDSEQSDTDGEVEDENDQPVFHDENEDEKALDINNNVADVADVNINFDEPAMESEQQFLDSIECDNAETGVTTTLLMGPKKSTGPTPFELSAASLDSPSSKPPLRANNETWAVF